MLQVAHVTSMADDGCFPSTVQGQAHPQEPVARFMAGSDRNALAAKLKGLPPEQLPCGFGAVSISQEDAKGGLLELQRLHNHRTGGILPESAL